MIQFEDLPRTNRTLLLATLELEIAEAKCTNILELAHKRNLPIADIWRDVCRRTGQPRCTVPAPVMLSRKQWLDGASSGHPETAASAVQAPTPAAATDGGATAGAIAMPALAVKPPRAAAMAASGAQRPRSLRAPLVAGLAAGLVAGLALGAAFFLLVASPHATVAPQASLQVPNARPGDVPRAATNIRDQSGESAPPAFDPNSLPPPQGTMRRLEGISKSFLNR
jgi:hypothetical protein